MRQAFMWISLVRRRSCGQRERSARDYAVGLLLRFALSAQGDAPATAGILRPLTLTCPEGSIVDARPPAAVAGGNVETSQRIVDVLLRALAKAVPERFRRRARGR